MKRTFLAAALAALCVVSAQAQGAVGSFSLKPMVGGTLTDIVGSDAEGTKMKVGFVGGAELSYQVAPQIAISGGALYAMQGCVMDQQYDPKMKLEYLNIPFLVNYYVAKGLAIKAGVQPGFLMKAETSASSNGISADIDVKDLYYKVDVAIPVGVSYEVSNFVIDARYCFGLMKIAKTHGTVMGQMIHDERNNVRNSMFMLTVGYNIPL